MNVSGKLNTEDMDRLLSGVKKPSRYVGNEFNVSRKEWHDTALRIALVFPDLYEIGMSHHGLQILYSVINMQDDLLADRAYAPDKDLEEVLRCKEKKLFGVESRKPLVEFDMIGITLPYELCYTNILTILELSGIPLWSKERDDSHPLIIGGGSGSFNPEPVADFFDAILLGDGEEAIIEMSAVIKDSRRSHWSRMKTLEKLTEVNGVYVPGFFKPSYSEEGGLLAIEPLLKGYEKVKRRIIPDLETSHATEKPLVPLVRIIHDRLGIEVARGCTRGCRFCQAGMIYRPVRERSADRVVEIAEKGMAAGGFEELALLSLSTGDYSCLSPALGRLMDVFASQYVSVSMPSMRVGTLTPEIMNQIKRVRKTGFTLAPEAGTDRLRQVINKGITEEDLLATCRDAYELGWKLIKFYFMFGLPTETQEDIEAIGGLVHRAASTSTDRRLRINVSVATFVPKPHTPFQWEPQISIEEAFSRIDLLKHKLSRGNFKLKWHDPRQSFLEGVMSRGDRRLADVILKAWQLGARLDAWTEHYDLDIWLQAAEKCNMDLSHYLRRRNFAEILPWEHLETGVDNEFLQAELARSLTGGYTPDCRVHGCQKCGVCDFKELSPVVQCKQKNDSGDDPGEEWIVKAADYLSLDIPETAATPVGKTSGEVLHKRYRIQYAKQGDIKFLSHLELIQVFFQAFRRAGVNMRYSQGFNPVPKASFSPALPVGTESLAEFIDIDLVDPVGDEKRFLQNLNDQLPDGITANSVMEIPGKRKGPVEKYIVGYHIHIGRELSDAEIAALDEFMDNESFVIQKMSKGRERKIDVRKQVEKIEASSQGRMDIELLNEEGKAVARPVEILKSLLDLTDEESSHIAVLKVWSRSVQ
jgi:radical SAM family uncharacterized protein/radical SAM-linked protein